MTYIIMKRPCDIFTLTVGAFVIGCGMLIGWIMTRKKRNESKPTVSWPAEKSASDFEYADHKLVLVVNNSLKMGKGKIAAQCSHASVLAYKQTMESNPNMVRYWENSGQRKVVLKASDEEELYTLLQASRKVGLTTSFISDAGKTQIAAGSKTVLGIGPGLNHLVDSITGHLRLL